MRRVRLLGRVKSPWARIDPRPWPFCLRIFFLGIPLGFVVWVWGGRMGVMIVSVILVVRVAIGWVGDVIGEGSFCGVHTDNVAVTIVRGVILFIVSEVIFFFAFFWGWAHNSWATSIYLFSYPPLGVSPVHPIGLPFFNLARLV